MSAFLGPIHHWLYRKVIIQNQFADRLVEGLLQEERCEAENEQFQKPLEEIIDEMNIHGWLQDKVSFVERKLAMVVTNCIKEEVATIEQLVERAYQIGCMNAKQENIIKELHAAEAYQFLQDTLLDGMPCDHVNQVVSRSEDSVVWKQTCEIHQKYWDEVQGNIEHYYLLRNAFIKGLFADTGLQYRIVEQNQFELAMEG